MSERVPVGASLMTSGAIQRRLPPISLNITPELLTERFGIAALSKRASPKSVSLTCRPS